MEYLCRGMEIPGSEFGAKIAMKQTIRSDVDVDDKEGVLVLEPKSFRPFKSKDEYLYAMKEDLAEWFNSLYSSYITVETFFSQLETGVLLCQHANSVQKMIDEHNWTTSGRNKHDFDPKSHITRIIPFRFGVKPESWQARDNVANFISWCRALGIMDVLLFETDDLVLRKNPKSVIFSLLEVARIGAKYGMLAPILIQLEKEIEQEIEREQNGLCADACESDNYIEPSVEYGPVPQKITCDLKSLDELVREQVSICCCPTQFRVVRISEGRYQIGSSLTHVFVRVLRSHVMVRIGGGWDTLEHYLDKHDPCRCKTGDHGFSSGTRSSGRVRRLSAPALFLVDALGEQQSKQHNENIPTQNNIQNNNNNVSSSTPVKKYKEGFGFHPGINSLRKHRSSSACRLQSREMNSSVESLNEELAEIGRKSRIARPSSAGKLRHVRSNTASPALPKKPSLSNDLVTNNKNNGDEKYHHARSKSVDPTNRDINPSRHRRVSTNTYNQSRLEKENDHNSGQTAQGRRRHSSWTRPPKSNETSDLIISRDRGGRHRLRRKDEENNFNQMIIETSQSIQMQMQQLANMDFTDGTSTEFSWSDATSQASDVTSESSLDESLKFQTNSRKFSQPNSRTSSPKPRPSVYPSLDSRARATNKVANYKQAALTKNKVGSRDNSLDRRGSNINHSPVMAQDRSSTRQRTISRDSSESRRVLSRDNSLTRKPVDHYRTRSTNRSYNQGNYSNTRSRDNSGDRQVVFTRTMQRRHSESELELAIERLRIRISPSPPKAVYFGSPRKDNRGGKPTKIPGPIPDVSFSLHRVDSGVDINGSVYK